MLESARPQAKSNSAFVNSNDPRQTHFRPADAQSAKSADIRSANRSATKQADANADQNRVSNRDAKSDSAGNGKTRVTDQNSTPRANAGGKDDDRKSVAADTGRPAANDDGAQQPVQAQQTTDPTGQAAAQAAQLAATAPLATPPEQMPANDPAEDSTISAAGDIKAAANAGSVAANQAPPPDAGQDSDPADDVPEATQPAILPPTSKPAANGNRVAAAKPDPAPVKDALKGQSDIGDDELVAAKSGAPANKDAAINPAAQPAPAKTDTAGKNALASQASDDDAAASPTPAQDANPNAVAANDTPPAPKLDAAQFNALAGQAVAGSKSAAPATGTPQTKNIRASQDNGGKDDKSLLAANEAPPVKDAPVTPDNGASNDKPGPKNAAISHGAAAAGDNSVSIKDSAAQGGDSQTTRNSDLSSQPPQPAPVQPPAQQAIPANNAAIGIQAPQPAVPGGAPSITAGIHVGPQSQDVAPNVNSLAVEIAAKSQSGAKQFDIRLDPPELGRVDVRLSIDAAGKAQAHLSADQPHTLHLLQNDSAILTRALRDAGLDVSQNGLNFSLRGQDRQAGDGHNNPRGGAPSHILQATKTIDAMPTGNITYSSSGNARLDIHV